jgi:hypothetical protein
MAKSNRITVYNDFLKTLYRGDRKYISKSDYAKYLKTDAWHKKRKEVLDIRGHKCEEPGCGATTNLQIHHLTYERLYHERITDFKVLCREHHEKVHNRNQRNRNLTVFHDNESVQNITASLHKDTQKKKSRQRIEDITFYLGLLVNFLLNGFWIMIISFGGTLILSLLYDKLPFRYTDRNRIIPNLVYYIFQIILFVIAFGLIPSGIHFFAK